MTCLETNPMGLPSYQCVRIRRRILCDAASQTLGGGVKRLLMATAVLVVAGLVTFLVFMSAGSGRVEVPLEQGRAPEVDGNRLTVYYVAHPTDSDPEAEVEESADSVTITVTVDEGCTGTCTAEGMVGPVAVTLDKPLGSRTVRDGSENWTPSPTVRSSSDSASVPMSARG